MKELVAKSFLQDYECRVIYNGADTGVFYPDNNTKYDFKDKRVLLAVAGDWDRRKGIDDMQLIADALPNTHIIVAIGNNAPQHNNIVSLARTESISELRQLYTRADCIINPTLEDNFPMVNLEALACGTPIAVYATGGCPEVVDKSVGFVAKKGDWKTLLQKALEISNNKESYSKNCLVRAKEFEKQKCYEGYIQLYEDILQKTPNNH